MRHAWVLLLLAACSSADERNNEEASPTTDVANVTTPSSNGSTPSSNDAPPNVIDYGGDADGGAGDAGTDAAKPPTKPSDPGPKPAGCTVTKDANGFFPRNGYVGYVPPTYDGSKAVHLLVGLHGCGDNAQNFATWALAPYDTRKTQQHIAISIGGRDGQCWQDADESKVLAAINDIKSCFWVDQNAVVMAGYSSGGVLAYRTAVKNSTTFAGLLIENSGFYPEGDETTLLAVASHKLSIAHIAHQSDGDFPLATVQADWTKIKNAGFPMQTSVVAGTHSGTSADWNSFLLPKLPAMKK